MKRVAIMIVLVALLLCMSMPAFAQTRMAQDAVQNNILNVASSQGDLKAFTGAVDAAGMRDTLSAAGPYTIFAPTDTAFKAVPTTTMDTLTKDKAQMTSVVKNHVVAGKYTIKDLRNMGYVTTLDGKTLKVSSSNGAFAVDGAHIVKNDVQAGNGIIHVVDTVIMPK